MRERMYKLLNEGEKITPKQWRQEIKTLQAEYDSIGREQAKAATKLAYAEVISYNRKNLERELLNEADSKIKCRAEGNEGRKKFNANFIVKIGVFLYN